MRAEIPSGPLDFVVYILLCVVMLVLQPQMSIEPVGMSRQLHSWEEEREGRGRRVGGYEGLGLSHMGTLLRSHMFSEQGIKLNWIENQEVGKSPHRSYKCMYLQNMWGNPLTL